MPKETVVSAGKRVGVSNKGLNVNCMQQEKLVQASGCRESSQQQTTTKNSSLIPLAIVSPQHSPWLCCILEKKI